MFFWRLAISVGVALLVLLATLLVGMAFYHALKPTSSWAQAFHRASMILSGMGPVEGDPEHEPSNVERIFAGVYALFSSFVLVTAIGLILTPVLHRALHHFHVLDDDSDEKATAPPHRAKPQLRKIPKRKSRRILNLHR
jgi:hypothetical protein